MSVEDKKLARLIRRELGRNQYLDFSEVVITVARFVGHIGGVIRPMMGLTIANPKEELKSLRDLAMRTPGIRDIVIEARIDTSAKRG